MQLVSVTAGLLPVITTATGHLFPLTDIVRRQQKDTQEAIDWNSWLVDHP